MSPDASAEIARLREEIRRHDRKYYIEAAPEISDLQYDRLVERLKKLEAEHPELVTPDEVGDAGSLNICLRLNGQTMQQSNTKQLIFPIDQLISYVSDVCTLKVGDVLFTGTPPGVGVARKPPVFLKPGDVVEVEIEKIGLLRNCVVAE